MINMFSVNTFDVLGKSNLPLDDPQDADLATGLFASFLIVPVTMPPVCPTAPEPAQNTDPSTVEGLTSVEPQINTPDISEPKDPLFLPDANIAGTEGLSVLSEKNPFAATFSEQDLPDNQPVYFTPGGFDTRPIRTKLADASTVWSAVVDQTENTAAAGNSSAVSLPVDLINNGQLLDEPAVRIPPSVEPNATHLSPVSSPAADVNVLNSALRQPDLSLETTTTKSTPTFQPETPLDMKQPDLPYEAPLMTLPAPLQQSGVLDPRLEGIIIEPSKAADINLSTKLTFPQPYTLPPWVRLQETLKEVSSIVRDDNSLKANSTSNVMPEQSILELANQNLSGDGGNTLDLSAAAPTIPDKKIKLSDGSVETLFNASLSEAVKTLHMPAGAVTEIIAREKIMQQVEPRMMELAAAMHSDGEKRVLKIRLTPPELGTVEVTLQKSASGRIDAHFQAESHETRHILNEGLMQLRESLERSGMRVGDLNTSFGAFSSTGNENRRDQSQKFGTAEVLSADTINFDGISKDEDDADGRLVNLRA